MKTVKFSLNELMSEIDESFIEEVYFHDCNKILKKYSKQKIRQFHSLRSEENTSELQSRFGSL